MAQISRSDVEDFLYLEAELLDQWQLDQWLKLYTDPCRYLVPSPGLPPDASPEENLFLVNDDSIRMAGRVARLGKRNAHSEYPHSITLHMVSNLRLGTPDGDTLPVNGVFQVMRTKDNTTHNFFGRVSYLLATDGPQLKIREKRCNLAMESLVPHGRLTIIL